MYLYSQNGGSGRFCLSKFVRVSNLAISKVSSVRERGKISQKI